MHDPNILIHARPASLRAPALAAAAGQAEPVAFFYLDKGSWSEASSTLTRTK